MFYLLLGASVVQLYLRAAVLATSNLQIRVAKLAGLHFKSLNYVWI